MDDEYKKELTLRAKTVAESVQEGAQLTGGKREKKRDEKGRSIASDLDNFCVAPKKAMSSDVVGEKRERPRDLNDLKSLFDEIDNKKRLKVESELVMKAK